MPSLDTASACSGDLTAATMFSFSKRAFLALKKSATMDPPLHESQIKAVSAT